MKTEAEKIEILKKCLNKETPQSLFEKLNKFKPVGMTINDYLYRNKTKKS